MSDNENDSYIYTVTGRRRPSAERADSAGLDSGSAAERADGAGLDIELDAEYDGNTELFEDSAFGAGKKTDPDTEIEFDAGTGAEFDAQAAFGPATGLDLDAVVDADADADADADESPVYSYSIEFAPDAASGPDAGLDPGSEEEIDPEEEIKLNALRREIRRRNDKRSWIVIAAAVCICAVSTLMFLNGVGPFATKIPAPVDDPAGDDVAPPVNVVESAGWATAGEGYKDLFALIDSQISGAWGAEADAAVMALDGDMPDSAPTAATADNGMDFGPMPMETMTEAEGGTAGTGYYEQMPQFLGEDGGTSGDTDASDIPEPDEAEPPETGSEDGDTDAGQGSTEEDPEPGEEEPEPGEDDPEPGEKEPEPGETDFSDTNEQVKGVREADVLKTDGKYIYAINSKNLVIVKAAKGEMTLVSSIPQPTEDVGQVYFEMYVAGDRLIAIRHGYNMSAIQRFMNDERYGAVTPETCIAYPIGGYITDTSVDIFDISDRSAPAKLHTLTQSGDYNNSRMIDGYLYLITTFYGGDQSQIDADDPRTFVPLYARDGVQYTPAESDIYLPPGTNWPCYTVISGIDAVGTGDFVSQKSVYGDAGTIYVSPGAVYLAHPSWTEKREVRGEYVAIMNSSETILSKLTIVAGRVAPGAQAQVPGYVLNQFSLDEYRGVLRVVMTNDKSTGFTFKDQTKSPTDAEWARFPQGEFTTTNALYTLNADLEVIGSIEGLAPDERVYSCRFMGDVAYFVTFRQTDPLFSVDVSDPSAPRVIGVLKIPGFSEYLHPYSDGRLFGLGRDADPETGWQRGLKLTMFDNSNPGDVTELHTLVVGDAYSAAEQNHKAILVSADKALIAFPTDSDYMIYGYSDAKGFEQIAEVKLESAYDVWVEIRGLFIGGTFYVIGPNSINAYAIDEAFAKAGSLRVGEGASSVNRWNYGFPMPFMPLAEPFEEEAPGPGAELPGVVDTID